MGDHAEPVTSASGFYWVGLMVLLLVASATLLVLHFIRRRRQTLGVASPPVQAQAAAPPARARPGTTDPIRPVGLPGTVDYWPDPASPTGAFPAQVGRYRILGLLGAGGMGTVYRAHDPQLDREVALKFPRFDGPSEEVARRVERFRREARAAARVLHPNVCPIFDVGEHEGRLFVVMALVDGESLAQRLAARGRYEDVAEATALIRQVLDGLAAIHARGVIHRDLKPANILLDSAGRAIVTDFGLARPEAEAGQLTSEGVILGTPAYMAPEQAAGQSDRIGPATDVYSLGVVLYQMLTGRPPFTGPVPAMLVQILRDEPPSPCEFRRDLDPALEAILLRTLRKDPTERYPDAQSLAKALDAWAGGTPYDPPAKPAPAPPAPPAPDPRSPLSPAPKRRFTFGRVAGWVIGGVVLTISMALLALLVLDLFFGAVILGIWLTLLTPPVALLGLALWSATEDGYVPEGLLLAARKGEVGGVRRALANGVPPDVRDEMGETPLMHAAAQRHADVVKQLLRHGASPGLRNSFGQTALDIARAAGHQEIAAVLETAGMSAGPPVGPVPRPDATRGLLIAAALGGLLTVGLVWRFAARTPALSHDEFLQLVKGGHVAKVTIVTEGNRNKWVEGKVKDPQDPQVRLLGLEGDGFTTDYLEKGKFIDFRNSLLVRGVPVESRVQSSGDHLFQPPPAWGLVPVLGLPLLIGFVLGRTLGAPRWFPVLGRPRRPVAVPRTA
jgi:hypothetical protein